MPTKSPSQRKLLLIVPVGISLAAILIYTASSNSRRKNEEIASIEKNVRDVPKDTTRNFFPLSSSSEKHAESEPPENRPARTKSNHRENAHSEASLAGTEREFWSAAKLPDDLIASSLPILQAARLPGDENSADGSKDYSTEVPNAFGQEESDYRKANDDLYNWLLTDPQAATEWIAKQSDYSKYDMAFGMIADKMALDGHLDIAKKWLGLIPGKERQHDATVNMYAGIYSRGGNVPDHLKNEISTSDKID